MPALPARQTILACVRSRIALFVRCLPPSLARRKSMSCSLVRPDSGARFIDARERLCSLARIDAREAVVFARARRDPTRLADLA